MRLRPRSLEFVPRMHVALPARTPAELRAPSSGEDAPSEAEWNRVPSARLEEQQQQQQE